MLGNFFHFLKVSLSAWIKIEDVNFHKVLISTKKECALLPSVNIFTVYTQAFRQLYFNFDYDIRPSIIIEINIKKKLKCFIIVIFFFLFIKHGQYSVHESTPYINKTCTTHFLVLFTPL